MIMLNEFINYEFNNRLNYTLFPHYAGFNNCSSNYGFGPGVKDHYTFIYVHEGKGSFTNKHCTYHLSNGEGFIVFPNQLSSYYANKNDPWKYSWITFSGTNIPILINQAGLNIESPVYLYNHDSQLTDCLTKIMCTLTNYKKFEVRLTGLLYELMSILIENNASPNILENTTDLKGYYLEEAVEFISINYSNSISIDDIANHVNISRKYLYLIFKQCLNISPQMFLIQYRIEKACILLKVQTLSIFEISQSVGYSDSSLFSKMFHKIKGISPSEYRNNL